MRTRLKRKPRDAGNDRVVHKKSHFRKDKRIDEESFAGGVGQWVKQTNVR